MSAEFSLVALCTLRLAISIYRRRDSPTPFTRAELDERPALCDDVRSRGDNDSMTGVCGESRGRLPTKELSNQQFLEIINARNQTWENQMPFQSGAENDGITWTKD